MPGAIVTEGDRVTFRTPESEDAEFLQRGQANPAVRYPLGSRIESREELDVTTGQDGGDYFVVTVADDGGPGTPETDTYERAGFVGIDDVSWRRPELGYWVAEEHQGQGYGTEAVALAVAYTFRTYDHPAVGASVYEFNDASRRLLESLGFEREGRTRRDRFIDGEYVDTLQYSLLREDWREESEASHGPHI
jgi:Acetyltransferases, including N-acetylases of ribosomal proteins